MRPALLSLLAVGLATVSALAQSPSPAAPPAGAAVPLVGAADCPTCAAAATPANHNKHTGPAPAVSEETLRAYGWVIANRAGLHLDLTPEQRKAVLAGIADCIAGEPEPAKVPTLSDEIGPFIQAKRSEASQKALVLAKAKTAKFFTDLEGRKGIMKTPSGLVYEILKEGTDPKATDADTVTVNYVGSELSGKVFDSSEKQGNKPMDLELAQTAVKGLVEGLKLVGKGGKVRLYINAELGFGDEPDAGPIPAGEGFIFEYEVVSIAPSSAPAPAAPSLPGLDLPPAPLPGQK